MRAKFKVLTAAVAVASCATSLAVAAPAGATPFPSFLSHFNGAVQVASTVPAANGDENPYGLVVIPQSTGLLVRGDSLVSNFNNSTNQQGTGTTIVQISPSGVVSPFAQLNPTALPGACPGGVGLTTALVVLSGGYVVVGSLPVTYSSTAAVPQPGCLIVLNNEGTPVETWSGPEINGPWDMTSFQIGGIAELFVTNVLNGLNGTAITNGNVVNQGTVVRLTVALPRGRPPALLASTTIASGFAEQLNTNAVVFGPTGVALGFDGALYVADTVNSRVAAIPFAAIRLTTLGGGGLTLSSGQALSGPLGMTLAPNGDIIVVNGGNGNAVEITPFGLQVANVTIDPFNTGGDLFGVAIAPFGQGLLFVDDNDNTLQLFTRITK